MGRCFVIQPFNNVYDKRYRDIYAPAIEAAGLEPYRVDQDPTAKVIIKKIKEEIENSDICLAEISLDNPNVWYELGYASCNGNVVMICEENKREKLPFDINSQSIIFYRTDSPSDFDKLKSDITIKLKAYLELDATWGRKGFNNKIEDTSILLDPECDECETIILGLLWDNAFFEDDANYYDVKYEFTQLGYKPLAFNMAVEKLIIRGLIEKCKQEKFNGEMACLLKLKESGKTYIINREGLYNLCRNSNNPLIPPPPPIPS